VCLLTDRIPDAIKVVAAGLRLVLSRNELQDSNPLVWGYRNVWFEFEPTDATLMIPVSAPDLEFTHDVFMACFTTQKAASFPSPYHDGPFSSWAVAIQQKQFRLLQTLLGTEYFATHQNERVRNAAGFVFIKAMYASKFLQEVEELQSKIENKKD
jgi:glucosamine-6-phosphate deaminase